MVPEGVTGCSYCQPQSGVPSKGQSLLACLSPGGIGLIAVPCPRPSMLAQCLPEPEVLSVQGGHLEGCSSHSSGERRTLPRVTNGLLGDL